jgi:hypothetical protein
VMVASFPAAAAKDPPLPTVEINGTDRMEGHLLAHSEATWYVFDSEGVLLAIPDDKVETVRVLPPKE